ncbi:helix-turn-helix transcriptional regulator [Frateuria aurantia]
MAQSGMDARSAETTPEALAQRRELGAFLMNCRARLDPVALGYSTRHRRTPGLRREEVALAAEVSVSWYTWIEQGREVRASMEVLGRLATVLRLSEAERLYLFALSGYPAPASEADETLTDGLSQLVLAMQPLPAYIRNARFDILVWNQAIADLFVDYAHLPPEQRNSIWLMYLYPPYRQQIVEWERVARGLLASLRGAYARAEDKASFQPLLDALLAGSEEFRRWWPEHEVDRFDEGIKRIEHPLRGRLELRYVALIPENRPELSLVTYLPA